MNQPDEGIRAHELLPGLSAQQSVQGMNVGYGVFVVAGPVLLLSFLVPQPDVAMAVRLVAVSIVVIGAVLLLIFRLTLDSRRAAEARAGYTTLRTGLPDLDMVDTRTGIVLRRAGEPPLDTATLRARVAAAKTARR